MKKLLFPLVLLLLLSFPALAKQTQDIEAVTLVKSSSSWNGAQLPAYPTGQPEISILRITIAPGAKLPMHEHPVINAGVLLTGELTVLAEDGKTLILKAGDPIVEVVSTWHYGANTGTTPAEIIVFYVGTPGQPITVKK